MIRPSQGESLTLSLSKSISIFHASLGENARQARQAGDAEGDQYWSGLVAEVDDMIWQAVHAGFGYFQLEAGYTRTGRREMARPGFPGLQRAHRRRRGDRCPAPGRSPHPKVRPGMDCAR
jgi:hypothetical protein